MYFQIKTSYTDVGLYTHLSSLLKLDAKPVKAKHP
jgi:hypothetical protein